MENPVHKAKECRSVLRVMGHNEELWPELHLLTFPRITSFPSPAWTLDHNSPTSSLPWGAKKWLHPHHHSDHSLCHPQLPSTPTSLIPAWTDLGRRGCPHPGILHGDIPQLHPGGMGFQETLLGATLGILSLYSHEGTPRLCPPAYKSTLFLTVHLHILPFCIYAHGFDVLHLHNIILQPHTLSGHLWTKMNCPLAQFVQIPSLWLQCTHLTMYNSTLLWHTYLQHH